MFAISSIVSLLNMFLTGSYDVTQEMTAAVLAGREITTAEIYALTEQYTSAMGLVLAIALRLCATVVSVGFAWYCFRAARGEMPETRSIFDGFGSFFKIIWLHIIMSVLIAVQLLLFIVPGIIAAIRYSQATYIMYEHPEYSAWRCIKESGRIMRGYKKEYFFLLLSFLGWLLIGAMLSLYIPVPVLDIWINIYWGLAAALFHVHLMRAELSGEKHRDSNII
ncbi:MAG: DUF975 family protein [Clostridiales bacterium]|nr:DUF975 family protein [Clostridiales bacterium]